MRTTRRALPAALAAALSLSLVAAAHPGDGAGSSVERERATAEATVAAAKADRGRKPTGMRNAGAPKDYIAQRDRLSKPVFPETVREVFTVPAHDDVELYVEVVRPDPEVHGDGPWPVILEASPYHGTLHERTGTRIFPDARNANGEQIGLTGYFAPRGYAVAMFDLRGTGRSAGCLDHLGPDDAQDLTTVVEWFADQPWSTGKVGMTGHSYVGSTPSVAAAQAPRGLVTIVPSAGLAAMYDHQFQYGVPYSLQWVGPMAAYSSLATQRHLPPGVPGPLGGASGDDFGNHPQDAACGWESSAAISGTGQVTGQYQAWHAARDWRDGATVADVPVFIVHGVNDNAARIPAAEWFFGRRFDRTQDKVWLGQWDHGGSVNNSCGQRHPNCRLDQWKYALHAWFDHHLKGMRVDTGPSVEAFLNDGTVFTSDAWRRPGETLTLRPDATDSSLSPSAPAGDGSASFRLANAWFVGTTGIEFATEPFARDTLFVGLPRLRLHASVSNSQIAHLVATLYREHTVVDDEGEEEVVREPMTYCTIQPMLREGVDTLTPVTPRAEMALDPQCFTMANRVHRGDRVVLRVGSISPHHVVAGADANVTVFTGPDRTAMTLPVVERAKVHRDVPLEEAEPGT